MKRTLGLIVFMAMLTALVVQATIPATFTWTPPATLMDGTPITTADISKYKIYCGDNTGTYTRSTEIAGGAVTSYIDDFTLVADGDTGYCAMTAFTLRGDESNFSQEVLVNFIPTAAPANFRWN